MRFPHQAQAFLRSKIFFAALASLVVLGVALVAALTWFKAERLQRSAHLDQYARRHLPHRRRAARPDARGVPQPGYRARRGAP